jgi:GNAT superfamily N-acetyltransferase
VTLLKPKASTGVAGDHSFEISPAGPHEAGLVQEIFQEAERWAEAKHSSLMTFLQADLERIHTAGELYIARLDGEPAAAFRFGWEADGIWVQNQSNAGYLSCLAVRRAYAGLGLGFQIIAWSATTARKRGRSYLRLACAANNASLHRYFMRAGFIPKGNCGTGKYEVTLFQRPIPNNG